MHRLSHPARCLVMVALAVCIALTGSAVARGAGVTQADVTRAAAAAIAHGKRGEAQAMAAARGPSDPAAAVVLAQLAAPRGEYQEERALPQASGPVRPPVRAGALSPAQRAPPRGKSREARALLEPIAARDQTGDAALALALLYR